MYKLKLTDDEVSALCFISDRYAWAGILYANLVQPEQEVRLLEHESWEWIDAVNDEGGTFPLASPEFTNKLYTFWTSLYE